VLSVGSAIGSAVYTGPETRSDEHESSTDEGWVEPGDHPTFLDVPFSASLGSARADCVQ